MKFCVTFAINVWHIVRRRYIRVRPIEPFGFTAFERLLATSIFYSRFWLLNPVGN